MEGKQALTVREVAQRLRRIAELARDLSERDLNEPDGAVQDAVAVLSFSHGFTRLTRRARVIRRIAARYVRS
jgi:hypothetical protein